MLQRRPGDSGGLPSFLCPLPRRRSDDGQGADPALASKAKGGPGADRDTLRAFHDALYEGYARDFGSRRNAMLRMKELWSYLIHLFRDPESYAKKLRKAADPAEFEALTAGMFRELELLPGLEPGFLF